MITSNSTRSSKNIFADSPSPGIDVVPDGSAGTPPPKLTFKELEARIHSHRAFRRRRQIPDSKGRSAFKKAIKAEALHYEDRRWHSLSNEQRQAMTSWSKRRIALAADDAYNHDTDAGKTMTSMVLLDDSVGGAIDHWRGVAMRYHLRVQADRKARAANSPPSTDPSAISMAIVCLPLPE